MIKQNFYHLKNRITSSSFVLDSFWAVLGSLISKGAGLISSVFIAKFLGSELFGQYGMIKNIVLSTAVFATFGIAYTSTKFIAENRNSGYLIIKLVNKFLLFTFLFSILFSIAIFFNNDYIAIEILKDSNLNSPLKYASFLIVLTAVSTTQTGIIAGLGEFKKLASSNLIIGISIIIFSILLCYYFNLLGALLALIITQSITIFLFYKVINKGIRLVKEDTILNDRIKWKPLLISSFPLALQEGIYSILYFANFWIIVNYASYSQLGIYSASMQWYSIILFIPGILRNVVLFHLSSSTSSNIEGKTVVSNTVKFNFFITIFPVIVLAAISAYIVDFYGDSFANMRPVLMAGLFASVFSSIGNVYSQVYISAGNTWELLLIRICRDGGITLISYLLIVNSNGDLAAFYLSMSLLLFHFLAATTMFLRHKYGNILLS